MMNKIEAVRGSTRTVFCVVLASLCLSGPVVAQVFKSKSASATFRSQTKVLDTRAKDQYRSAVRLEPVKVYTPSKWGDGSFQGKYNGPYLAMAREAALRNGVPVDMFLKLVQQESGWNATAKSHKGALGLAQLMPETARHLNVDPLDPYQNLDGGARYLARQYSSFGSWRLALAAYNAGPQAVRKYGGVPPYKETQNYVRVILGS
ncbi:lytic transglycosylase domain-containing protein [uncultured Shimia sp.]|uniref:lytic transglycosylase domain-containing protein n=1 Tax=uncultured Shimia sp. TaxID=573152 RepID=UPI0026305F15|nr:lytic transglycosylase domain-containing protein [uncultured Shimia sp.]